MTIRFTIKNEESPDSRRVLHLRQQTKEGGLIKLIPIKELYGGEEYLICLPSTDNVLIGSSLKQLDT